MIWLQFLINIYDMASSSQNPSAKYDVFISFRGKDVRRGFLSHLKTKLKQNDIDAFVDDRLESGDKISSALFRAIEKSKSSLVIFSENYAESTWCLEELAKIVDCMNKKKHIVIPVFLEIDPSIVRHQKGSYADAFVQHGKHHKANVQSWRSALYDAASLSGIHYSESSCLSPKDEAELVERIAQALFRKLKGKSSENMTRLMNTTMPSKQFVDEYDNAVEELMNMETADNNNNVNRELSSWGQKKNKNKNKKEDFLSSSTQVIGANNNKTSRTVTNSGQHQQKKPMSMEVFYEDVGDYVDQDLSSWGQNKNKKQDYLSSSSSQFPIGVGANNIGISVTNSGQQHHQQKKPQYYSQSHHKSSYRSKQVGVNDDEYAHYATEESSDSSDDDEFDESSDSSDDDEEYVVQGSSPWWQNKSENKTKKKHLSSSQVGAILSSKTSSSTVTNFRQHQQKKPQHFRPYEGFM